MRRKRVGKAADVAHIDAREGGVQDGMFVIHSSNACHYIVASVPIEPEALIFVCARHNPAPPAHFWKVVSTMYRASALLVTLAVLPAAASADSKATPRPTSSPVPSATPARSPSAPPEAAGDPCGGSTRLLASLDRPTIGFSTCVAPVGSAIIEEGYQLNTQGGPAASVSATYPQGFQRFGILPRLEIDLIGPNFNRVRSDAGISSGFSDLGVGFKYQFQQKTKVQWAIDGLFTAATGASAFTAGGPTEQLNLDIAYPLSANVGIGTTIGFASTSGAPSNAGAATASSTASKYSRYGAIIPSIVVTDQVNHLTQFYAEYVNPTKIAPDLGGRSFTDFGIQRLFGQYVEVDAEYGIDFTPVQGSRFRYVGLGFGVYIK